MWTRNKSRISSKARQSTIKTHLMSVWPLSSHCLLPLVYTSLSSTFNRQSFIWVSPQMSVNFNVCRQLWRCEQALVFLGLHWVVCRFSTRFISSADHVACRMYLPANRFRYMVFWESPVVTITIRISFAQWFIPVRVLLKSKQTNSVSHLGTGT